MPATIYLEPDDVLGSIKAKIEERGSDPVTLIAPYGVGALKNPVALRLLRRHLEGLGIRATLICRDEDLVALAKGEGLRALRSSGRGAAGPAPDSMRTGRTHAAYGDTQARGRTRSRVGVALAVAAGALALGVPVSAAAVMLPAATVTLYTETQAFDETVQLRASTLVSRPDPANLAVPGSALETHFEREERLDLSPEIAAPRRAEGQVLLGNRSPAPVEIRSGLRVGTASGRAYLLQDAATLQPGQDLSFPVSAVEAGVGGNTGPRTIDRLLEPGFPFIAVSNPETVQGGRDRTAPRVTDAHYRQLKEQAVTAGRSDAVTRLHDEDGHTYSFYDSSTTVRVLEEELVPPIGQQAEEVTLRIRGTVQAVAFEGADVNQVLLRHVSQAEGLSLIENSFQSAPLELVRSDPDEIRFHVRVRGLRGPVLDEEQLRNLIKGKPAREAEALLASEIELVDHATVETQPFWVSGVPVLPWRISFRTSQP